MMFEQPGRPGDALKMAKTRKTPTIVTFKADQSLLVALQGIENRSEFIRAALLTALENICPLCKGRGILTPNQRNHWKSFADDHELEECDDCHEFHLVCHSGPRRRVRRAHRSGGRDSGTRRTGASK